MCTLWLDLRVLGSYLSSTHTDDPVHIPGGIIKEGHSDGMFAGRQPVAFGGRVDLEDMSSGTEDGLLSLKEKTGKNLLVTVWCHVH